MTSPTLLSPSIAAYSPKIRDQAVARRFIGQNGQGYMSIGIVDGSTPVDADTDTLHLQVWFNDTVTDYGDQPGDLIVNVDDHSGSDIIQREDVGKYFYDLGPGHTGNRGVLHAEWTYEVGGVDFKYSDDMQILSQMPMYDRLTEANKGIVEQVSFMFADMFDSTNGGPWLQENFQTHFDYERIAQLMGMASTRLNTTGYPVTNYGVAIGDPSIPANFSGVMVWGTYLEVIRHLIRSYTEQPQFVNMQTTYTDRRDYSQRWQAILQEEDQAYTKAIKMIKRSLLQLGRGSLLVAGGWYGSGAGVFRPGMYSAQVRSFRFYPAAPAISWGALGSVT